MTFDPTNVLPDKALWPYTPIDVQRFLTEKNSFLANQKWDTDQGPTPISLLISRWAGASNVNPAWILVRLQAEQGLISTTTEKSLEWALQPKTWKEVGTDGRLSDVRGTVLDYRLRWALGFSAFEGGFRPVLNGILMAGIGNQIRRMAEWSRRAYDNTARSIPTLTIDGAALVPKTRATYALYRYTPHISAARSTQAVFERYFPQYTYAA